MSTYTYKTNINCNNCIQTVSPFLNDLDNIDSWKVDIDNVDKILSVVLEDDNHKLIEDAVVRAGFSIRPI